MPQRDKMMPELEPEYDHLLEDDPLRDVWDDDPVCNATKVLVDAVNAVQAAFNFYGGPGPFREELLNKVLRNALAARKKAIRDLVKAQEEYDASEDFFHG